MDGLDVRDEAPSAVRGRLNELLGVEQFAHALSGAVATGNDLGRAAAQVELEGGEDHCDSECRGDEEEQPPRAGSSHARP